MLKLTTDLQPAASDAQTEAPVKMLLSAAELALQLGVSVKTITRLNQSGKLPAPVRIGHSKRWPRQTVVDWIAAGAPCRRDWERLRR